MKLKKQKVQLRNIILIILLIASIAFGIHYITRPKIIFNENPVILEINQSYDPGSFIKEVKHAQRDDIKINGTFDTKQLGKNKLIYDLKGHHFTLTYEVKDTKAPVVKTKNVTITIGDKVEAKDFIKKIDDETKTTITFKKDYSFDKIQDLKVELIITDEGSNTTNAKATLHILEKDKKAPVFKGLDDVTIYQDTNFDFYQGVEAIDERDGKVDFSVDISKLDKHVLGTYKVYYTAKDNAGNIAKKARKVTIKKANNDKIIYLTIDDGPSANTPKVLDILDRYHVKATFFVTGQFPSYLNYIKVAYQKGHAIGLHTYSHDYGSVYASEDAYYRDLNKISDIVYKQTGQRSHIIRFPGGSSNTISSFNPGIMSRLTSSVRAKGYQYFDWNGSNGDGNSALPASTLIREAKSYGGISPLMMLTHDHAGSHASVEALPAIIEYYQSLGYTFKTVNINTSGFHHGVNN